MLRMSKAQPETKTMKLFDVIVVGGGLSGVLVGHHLEQHRHPAVVDWKLLEARPELGGRLMNSKEKDGSSGKIDMGGAWIWPTAQPHMKALVQKLNIPTFPQPDDPSSTRIDGGAVEIVRSLVSSVDKNNKKNDHEKQNRFEVNSPVTSCTLDLTTSPNEKLVRLITSNDQTFLARRVVFAVPPNVILKHVTFHPPLSERKQSAMQRCHTWMAGVTKVALVYPSPRFWNLEHSNMGLPQQQHGTAFQVYDSSTKDQSVSALTFFALVKPEPHGAPLLQDDEMLAKQVASQMSRVWDSWGQKEAANQVHYFTQYHVQRWPLEEYISEHNTPDRIHPHPAPIKALSEPEWDGLLEFAGSETDLQSPGVMEGALGAANHVYQSLLKSSFFQSLPLDRPRQIPLEENKQQQQQQQQQQQTSAKVVGQRL